MPLIHKWHGFNVSIFMVYVYMFFLINEVNVSASQPAAAPDCMVNAETSSPFGNCNGGYWGGFLNKNCSGGAFCHYLYALALRANQTGKIFLDLSEQRRCWNNMKANEADVSGCGMQKLTAGLGGCSDFSTDDVNSKLRYKLERLKGKCGTSPADEWGDSCGSCLRSWEEIKKMHLDGGKSMEEDSEVCRFAVLITLVSTEINDEERVSKLYNCLGNQQKHKRIGPGLYILIGGVVGLLVVVIVSVLIFSQRRKMPIAPADKDAWRPVLSNFPAWKPALSAIPKESSILKVSIEEVWAATNNLLESNLIGEGTSGKVYRGVLSNNQHVAIKKITDDGCVHTFLREIRSLVQVRHPNLVALVGYCENGSECFLIYELCPNGSLSEWLYGKDKVLSWIQRLEIAIGSARGLRFLHMFPQGCIVHRDVKPTNILLGTNFEAKLSDFGLSKVMNLGESCVSSEVRGTFGYVDPEYQSNRQVSAASDIYSFGVVLLQILSGRKVINMDMKKPKPLYKIAKSFMEKGSVAEFADPNLNGEYSVEAFGSVFELALLCIGHKRERPSITRVIVKLEEALSISMRTKAPSPHTTPDCSEKL
ncbi:Receptor-like protein kinase ANXUR2 [Sesamum alatum]|uniref:Receptor-like protein kinase ANXUR2 n=1 Tax=Sesamum alatum TaxID=300844 RepID=A0AAE1XUC5_9LAMI|nr:Receptor-like protein kinase ANXUR2 [Sesamum alatum]